MLFAGDDWAEDHHDVEVQDESGRVLGRARLPEGVAGIGRFHELIGRFADPDAGPDQTERCSHLLEAPVQRVGGWNTPYPPARTEELYLPDLDRVLDAVDATYQH